MLEEILNYLPVVSRGYNILNFSLYKEVIKKCAAKKYNEIHYCEVCQAGDQLCVLIIMGFEVFARL